jgi:hypothetical protein
MSAGTSPAKFWPVTAAERAVWKEAVIWVALGLAVHFCMLGRPIRGLPNRPPNFGRGQRLAGQTTCRIQTRPKFPLSKKKVHCLFALFFQTFIWG